MSIIETKRLQLRQPLLTDISILHGLWQNKMVRQFLGGVISREAIDEKIALLQDRWNKHGFGEWSVFDKNDNQVIGICGVHYSEDGAELSYMFFPESWGKGLAKEAVLASLGYGFNKLKLEKIIAITQEENQRSCGLLEKIGMRHINKFRRFNAVQCLYELTQSDWYLKNG